MRSRRALPPVFLQNVIWGAVRPVSWAIGDAIAVAGRYGISTDILSLNVLIFQALQHIGRILLYR